MRGKRGILRENRGERRVLTPANGVTLARAALILPAGILFLAGGEDRLAVGLCAVSIALDAADGWIARRWRHETSLGALLDPVADKIAAFVVFGTIAMRAESPVVWSLFALGTLRDAVLTVQRIRRAPSGKRLVEPDAAGKFKTVLQDGIGLGILVEAAYIDPGFSCASGIVVSLMAVGVAVSYFSWGRYATAFRRSPAAGRAPGDEIA